MDRIYLLRIANYEYFISEYTNTAGCYVSPHAIIADLEKQVCHSRYNHDPISLVTYKDDGDCIFNFNRIEHDGYSIYIVYDYNGTIS